MARDKIQNQVELYFSNFNVHMNHPRTLLKFRFGFSQSCGEGGPDSVLLTSSQVTDAIAAGPGTAFEWPGWRDPCLGPPSDILTWTSVLELTNRFSFFCKLQWSFLKLFIVVIYFFKLKETFYLACICIQNAETLKDTVGLS